MTGYVHSIETFGSVDGPGIRFVIFLTGCNMRCQFCHNPDTWESGRGTEYTADELLKKALRYKTYWGDAGGITVSGGEPLLQIDFLTELFRKAKEMGINTCLDTAGQPFTRENPFFDKFVELMKYTDLVMLDIKNIDDEKHKALTGHTNANILDCARYLSDTGKDMWIRHVLVSGGVGASDDDGLLKKLAVFIGVMGVSVSERGIIPAYANNSEAERIIVHIAKAISNHGILPALVGGLILAGILASTMSTADSQLLAASSSVSHNIFSGLFHIKMGKKMPVIIARISVVLIAVVAIFIARNPESSVFEIVSFAWAGFGAAFGPVVLFSLFWKRTTLWGALAGMVSGGAMVFIWKYVIAGFGGVFAIYELLPAFLVSSILIIVVSLLTKKPSEDIVKEFELAKSKEKI